MKSHNDTAYAALPPSYAAAHGDFEDLDLDAPGRVQGGALRRWFEHARRGLFLSSVAMLLLVMGFCLGRSHEHRVRGGGGSAESMAAAILGAGAGGGLLPQQAFVPEIPTTEVVFDFPTPYEDTSVEGDKLWDALMPIGSGFVRVPNPRRYDMPESKAIEDDPEEAEIYSVSVLHQLHCLGVIRDVIKNYEKNEPSRFARGGHEYHCLDYLRQAVMCNGDTTLDYAELHDDGTRRGFSGANSTHQCRSWDAIVGWAVENRAGDKKGIA